MPDISVSFVHPTDGRIISVTMDDTMTGQEVIAELIGANFIPPSGEGYMLNIKGGAAIDNNRTLSAGGVKDGDTIRVLPSTNAGY